MAKQDFHCETCGRNAERLFQSYSRDGVYECAECASDDAGASPAQLARVQRYITKSAQARRNFGHVIQEPAAFVAAEGRLFT